MTVSVKNPKQQLHKKRKYERTLRFPSYLE